MAAALVAARVRALGGSPAVRPGYRSDDGMAILDVTGLDLSDPERLEAELDAIPGVVENGIFARRRARTSSSPARTPACAPSRRHMSSSEMCPAARRR